LLSKLTKCRLLAIVDGRTKFSFIVGYIRRGGCPILQRAFS
jgi:hypothetical protein